MDISKRLVMVADMVNCATIADIGTDHGYVPLYLYEKKRITKAYACDINKGSLQKAIDHIALFGAGDVIETRLGDGLHSMKPHEAETLILTGIGGMLLVRILRECPEVVSSAKELVLSPQRHVDLVRRYLHEIGFSIAEEAMFTEERKNYIVIRAIQGEEKYDREVDYLFGKRLLEEKNAVLRDALEKEKKKTEKLLALLASQHTEHAQQRMKDVERKYTWIEEALVCLQR